MGVDNQDCVLDYFSRPYGTGLVFLIPTQTSWAKFNRPCGTGVRKSSSHTPSLCPELHFLIAFPQKPVIFPQPV
jgi:hypothetical protein